MSKIKALVLLSGGLDSVYNLYEVHNRWPGQVSALFFTYGQRALVPERSAAQHFAQDLRIDLQDIDISSLFKMDSSALTSIQTEVPTDGVNIESLEASKESMKSVWVANRNGVFLNVGACLAEIMGADLVVPGFNAEEAQTFPDNSVEYIHKMNECLKMSTRNQVQIECFSQDLNKSQIVKKARELDVDLSRLWSCYHAGDRPCGRCESCQRLARATGQEISYAD